MRIFNCCDNKPERAIRALRYWPTRKESGRIHEGREGKKRLD